MKISPQKIHAFTLSEMLVVLLITTIVVGMAFSVLNLVQKQMQGVAQLYERDTDRNRLKQALWIDFNRGSRVYYSEKLQSLQFTNALNKISYRFEEEYITRDQDTFRLSVASKQLLFENLNISEGEVDALQLRFSEEHLPVFVFKRNAADSFMNY